MILSCGYPLDAATGIDPRLVWMGEAQGCEVAEDVLGGITAALE
jgi:hypothetical protein